MNNVRIQTSSFSKSSGFHRPHGNRKTAFSKKIPLWRASESCVFGDRFHRIRVNGLAYPQRKSCVFKRKRIRVDEALVGELDCEQTLFSSEIRGKKNSKASESAASGCE